MSLEEFHPGAFMICGGRLTGMAEIGIAPHIVEAALNHISGAKAGVAGTYNRQLTLSKRTALERWADHVAGLTSGRGANVVPHLRHAENT